MSAFEALRDGDSWQFADCGDPRCPHCGDLCGITTYEWYFLYEEGDHDVECPHCKGAFVVNSKARFTFSTDDQENPS